eukprot:TRINITY_DN2840_c0_g3_i1.p1 TRINITY_DN2840_c0_g3~~TRINITY_DN2840_c0_g3_i1.p1  ORF type:complete len:313 (+),score=25.47 TRINITY_DN2840_c0_g3_i1:67-1005(+)
MEMDVMSNNNNNHTLAHSSSGDNVDMGIVGYIQGIFCVLSIAGSLFIIINFLSLSKMRRSHPRLVFFLSISNLILAVIGFLSSPFISLQNCYIESILLEFAFTSASIWTLCVETNLAMMIYKVPIVQMREKEKFYHLVAWGVPAILTSVLLVVRHLTARNEFDYDVVCWTDLSSFPIQSFEFYYFHLPIGFIFCINICIFILIAYRLHKEDLATREDSVTQSLLTTKKQVFTRIILYPLSFSICYAGTLISIFYKPSDLLLQHIFYLPTWLHGFLCGIAYFVTPKLWTEYLKYWYQFRGLQQNNAGHTSFAS